MSPCGAVSGDKGLYLVGLESVIERRMKVTMPTMLLTKCAYIRATVRAGSAGTEDSMDKV